MSNNEIDSNEAGSGTNREGEAPAEPHLPVHAKLARQAESA